MMNALANLSNIIIPALIFYIVAYGVIHHTNVYEDFIKGAEDGFKTVIQIMPTLIGLMMAVGILRASGFLDFLGEMLKAPAALIHLPPQIVPVVLVRLVSNSAATGLVLDIFKEYGTDSSIGLIASVLMSSTETVLYCMSIYFSSVGIRKGRYTLAGGLFATAVGVAASVFLAGAIR